MKNCSTISALLIALAVILLFAACASNATQTEPRPETTPAPTAAPTAAPTQAPAPTESSAPAGTGSGETAGEQGGAAPADETGSEPVEVRIGSLKGPTTMGIVNLMKAAEKGETADRYSFTMATDASEIAAGIVKGDLDVALVPANLAAVLYNNKTDKGITVIDVNTLGVLYCVTGDESIGSVGDLAGKTVYLTGQGTTPEYSLRYLLDRFGVKDCTLEFKSEAAEVAAVLASDPQAIGVLPQPFATVAQAQNEALREAFYLSEAWAAVSEGSRSITGVTIVRKDFLTENPEAVSRFIEAHGASAAAANSDVEGTAALVVEYGIIEKAPIAGKALPKCGITCLTGEEMKEAVMGYLRVLYDADPSSVGGAMPEDGFCLVG